MITKKYYKLVKVSYADSDYFRVTNVDTTSGTLTINGSNNLGCNIEYSTDGVNWTTADSNAPFSLTVPSGANVYMRGTNNSMATGYSSSPTARPIHFDKLHTVGGNIFSLINKTDYSTMTSVGGNIIFYGLFYNDTNLVSVDDLNLGNVTTMSGAQKAMNSMFYGCSSLTKGLDLSGLTTLDSGINNDGYAAMAHMYRGCTSITSVTAPNVSSYNRDRTFANWLYSTGVNNGTVLAPSALEGTIPLNSDSGVPSGWTVVYY